MNARVRHQIRLEFSYVHVERSVETQRYRQRRDDLRKQAVHSNIRVLKQGVHAQNGVVRLHLEEHITIDGLGETRFRRWSRT